MTSIIHIDDIPCLFRGQPFQQVLEGILFGLNMRSSSPISRQPSCAFIRVWGHPSHVSTLQPAEATYAAVTPQEVPSSKTAPLCRCIEASGTMRARLAGVNDRRAQASWFGWPKPCLVVRPAPCTQICSRPTSMNQTTTLDAIVRWCGLDPPHLRLQPFGPVILVGLKRFPQKEHWRMKAAPRDAKPRVPTPHFPAIFANGQMPN